MTKQQQNRILTTTLALLVLFSAAPLSAQLGLGLAPMRLELRFPGPAAQSGALTLTNGSGAKVRVRAEILDFFLDGLETPQFARSYEQESQYSCRAWLSVNPMETELEAGATTLIRYTMRVPQGAVERGYHCAAGFTTLPAGDQLSGTSLKTAVRVVAAFYATVGKPAIDGTLKDIKLERTPKTEKNPAGWRAVVILDNPGWIHYRPTGELIVADESGKVVEKHDLNAIPVLPRREQRFLLPLESTLEGGTYTLHARVDIGTHEIQEATVQVKPVAPPAPVKQVGQPSSSGNTSTSGARN